MKKLLLIGTLSLGVFLVLYQILVMNTDLSVAVTVIIAALTASLFMDIVSRLFVSGSIPTYLVIEGSVLANVSVVMIALSWEIYFNLLPSLGPVIGGRFVTGMALIVTLLLIYLTVVRLLKITAYYQYPKWKTVLTVVMFLAIIWGGIATRIFLF